MSNTPATVVCRTAHGLTRMFGLNQCRETGQYQGHTADDADQVQHVRRQSEQAVGTCNQVNTSGNHGCGVDQSRNRRRTGHRIRQPGLQRQLRGFTHGATLAPEILHLVGIVGGVTLVLAGFAALVQTDIKRILAYSTMSQIGYMFLAKAYARNVPILVMRRRLADIAATFP